MEHGISMEQWFGYLGGTLDRATRQAVDSHLLECAECREIRDGLLCWEELLQGQASILRAAMGPAEKDVDRLTDAVLARARQTAPAVVKPTIDEALAFLRSLLAPICGSRTAEKSMQLAALRSSADALGGVSASSWEKFGPELSAIVACMCGGSAGQLVNLATARLAVAEAPK